MGRIRLLVAALLLAGCGEPDGTPAGDRVRMNQIQVIATHNSYHVAPDVEPPIPAEMDYTQPPILEQLEAYGVRQLELDVWETDDATFNCFHGLLVDEGTHCRDIRDCLATARDWSDAHPRHVPLVLVIEVKQVYGVNGPDDREAILASGFFEDLQAMFVDAFGRDRILAPDDVRGARDTLRQALAEDGWPELGRVRGKVMIVLNVTSARMGIMDAYLEKYPGLRGALLFAKKGFDDEWGAVLELNNVTRDAADIATGLAANYLIRSASDGIGWDEAQIEALAPITPPSGVHWINTDFLVAQPGFDYVFSWPSAHPVRCNPATAPADCDDATLE